MTAALDMNGAARPFAAGVTARLAVVPMSPILLGLRLGIGAIFFNSAMLRLRSWEFGIRLFRDEFRLPLIDPETAAVAATTVELSMALLLFAGLFTRLATLPLLGMTAVIQFLVFPDAWTTHLLWASILTLLLTRGPGVFSLDYAFAGRPRASGAAMFAVAAGAIGVAAAASWWLVALLGSVGRSGLTVGCLFFTDRCPEAASGVGWFQALFWASMAIGLAGLVVLITADARRGRLG